MRSVSVLYQRQGVRHRHHTVHRLQRLAAQEVHWTVTGPVQCVRRRQRPIRVQMCIGRHDDGTYDCAVPLAKLRTDPRQRTARRIR